MPTIDDTVAGATANSYIDVADADIYFDARLNTTAWDDSFDQEAALIQACTILDQQDFIGVVSSDTQALKWPRYADDGTSLIRNYAITSIPTPIRNAQCEIALWLLQTGGSGVAVSAGDVESLKIGSSVEVKYAAATTTTEVNDTSVDDTGLPVQAARMLKGLRLIPVLA
jgi:DnaT-like ssDNA binding protein